MNKFISFLLCCCLLLACKEDEPVDIRKQGVGSYDYNGMMYYLNRSVLTELPDSDFTGSLDVAIDPADDIGLIITESTDGVTTTYKGQKLAATDNGFSFDIASQALSAGSTLILSGYDGYKNVTKGGASTLYHGGFVSTTQILGFWWQYRDVNTGITFVAHIEGTRK